MIFCTSSEHESSVAPVFSAFSKVLAASCQASIALHETLQIDTKFRHTPDVAVPATLRSKHGLTWHGGQPAVRSKHACCGVLLNRNWQSPISHSTPALPEALSTPPIPSTHLPTPPLLPMEALLSAPAPSAAGAASFGKLTTRRYYQARLTERRRNRRCRMFHLSGTDGNRGERKRSCTLCPMQSSCVSSMLKRVPQIRVIQEMSFLQSRIRPDKRVMGTIRIK